MSETKMRVKQLYTYPIKSIRGISLPSFPAMYGGFPHDRHFMLYHVSKAKNMHVPDFTEMCLFTTSFVDSDVPIPRKLRVHYTKNHVFDKPDQEVPAEPLEIDLSIDTSDMATLEITMHENSCTGYDMGPTYNDWFSLRFGYAVKLLYIGNSHRKLLGNMAPSVALKQRPALGTTSGNAATNGGILGSISSMGSAATSLVRSVMGSEQGLESRDDTIGFADVAPYMVVSTKSCENVQRRLPSDEVMDISKFRPNIIVEGADEDFEEDYWADLQIGDEGVKMILTQNCNRCNSINVDYETGKVGRGEAGKVLKKLQGDRRVDPGAKWSPVFGRYGSLAKLPGDVSMMEVSVGDEVTVLKRNAARTVLEYPHVKTV